MENQPSRLPWLNRLATLRAAEIDNQAQPEPAQPATPAQAPPATTGRQPILPVIRVPLVPPPGPQPRAPAPPPPELSSQPRIRPLPPLPTAQPVQPNPRPVTPPQSNPRPVTPPQPTPRPVTPPQQDTPKPVVPASNGASSSPRTAPSPPPSPKVIKTSNPTPPPSPRVTMVPQAPLISGSNDKAANPEAEIMPTPELSRLKTIAMQEDRDTKANGNGGSYNNTNTTNGIYAETGSKMNDSTYKNGNKINNGTNGKVTFSNFNHNNTNLSTQPEKNGTENGHGMFDERSKHHHHQHHHLNSNTTMSNPHHKKSEKDMKVITIAGENIGAFMELGHNVQGYGRKTHHGGHSLTSGPVMQDGKASASKDNKGVVRAKPVTSLVNSNVQSINNSLLFNSSCTHKSPGVYLTLNSKTKGKAHKPSLDSPSS